MKLLEKNLKALANKRRLMILKYLKEFKKATVGEVAEEIKLSFKSTSRHLAILFAAGILDRDQEKLQVFYSISSVQKPEVQRILTIL